ncbi:hypothetical protein NH26_00715 [Flammeovirga pacifica]|uniref:Uncharacterized protein n=2 Tax=Flammeovirga pacifica TaxID=915059 RepID=A0A1S1YVC4_FLAPC|nr:hypothetical protein NH26_00715 [Flammeovirga pacifica]
MYKVLLLLSLFSCELLEDKNINAPFLYVISDNAPLKGVSFHFTPNYTSIIANEISVDYVSDGDFLLGRNQIGKTSFWRINGQSEIQSINEIYNYVLREKILVNNEVILMGDSLGFPVYNTINGEAISSYVSYNEYGNWLMPKDILLHNNQEYYFFEEEVNDHVRVVLQVYEQKLLINQYSFWLNFADVTYQYADFNDELLEVYIGESIDEGVSIKKINFQPELNEVIGVEQILERGRIFKVDNRIFYAEKEDQDIWLFYKSTSPYLKNRLSEVKQVNYLYYPDSNKEDCYVSYVDNQHQYKSVYIQNGKINQLGNRENTIINDIHRSDHYDHRLMTMKMRGEFKVVYERIPL